MRGPAQREISLPLALARESQQEREEEANPKFAQAIEIFTGIE